MIVSVSFINILALVAFAPQKVVSGGGGTTPIPPRPNSTTCENREEFNRVPEYNRFCSCLWSIIPKSEDYCYRCYVLPHPYDNSCN